jgi:hypothetical protein
MFSGAYVPVLMSIRGRGRVYSGSRVTSVSRAMPRTPGNGGKRSGVEHSKALGRKGSMQPEDMGLLL